jgi:hypothetical protein
MRRELDRTLYLQARFEGRTMHMNRISTLITRTKALMRVEAEYQVNQEGVRHGRDRLSVQAESPLLRDGESKRLDSDR